MGDSRSVGNVSTNVCANFRCAPLHIKKALGIFRELITTTTTRVAFLGSAFRSKNCRVERIEDRTKIIYR